MNMKTDSNALLNGASKVKSFLEKYSKKRIILSVLAVLLAVILLFQCAAVAAAYHFALTHSGARSFKSKDGSSVFGNEEENAAWLESVSEEMSLTSFDGLKLNAYYIKNENVSSSYAVLCHAYAESAASMAEYAKHYYDLGFNILLPDARAHGKSEGKYIGMGWEDRLDLLKWVDMIVEKDADARILLHGVSLGGAAVLAASGESLPQNVRCIISDSAWESEWEEFKYQAKESFSLPSFPVLYMESLYVKLRTGRSLKDADISSQVEKSKTPTLFIHGEADTVVPITQCNRLFDSCFVEKEQYIAKNAGHCEAAFKDSEKYWAKVDRFMLKHFSL